MSKIFSSGTKLVSGALDGEVEDYVVKIFQPDPGDIRFTNIVWRVGETVKVEWVSVSNIEYLLEHDLQENSQKVGQQLRSALEGLAEEHEVIGEVRGKGLMIGVELVEAGTTTPNAGAAGQIMESTREAGLLIGKGGLHGNALRIAPPLSLTEEEATRRMSSQKDDAFRAKFAHVVITNSGDRHKLARQVARLWHTRVAPTRFVAVSILVAAVVAGGALLVMRRRR